MLIYAVSGLMVLIGFALLVQHRIEKAVQLALRWRRTLPRFTLWDYPPGKWIKRQLEIRKQERMDMELYESLSYMRNLTVIGNGATIRADVLFEELAERGGLLGPIYGRMLRLLRQNQKEQATEAFIQSVNTEFSKDFARLLMQWDDTQPRDLTETLLNHQKNLKEARMTIQKRRDEFVSDLVYLPVVINVMLVFLNFIYVAYFIDQKQLLTLFF